MAPCSGRKHTPIVSKAQRRFFGAELSRAKKGQETSMSVPMIMRHLEESAGKSLPEKVKKKR